MFRFGDTMYRYFPILSLIGTVKVKNIDRRAEVEIPCVDLADYLNMAIKSEFYTVQKTRRSEFSNLFEGNTISMTCTSSR